jgi:hypothetical protein
MGGPLLRTSSRGNRPPSNLPRFLSALAIPLPFHVSITRRRSGQSGAGGRGPLPDQSGYPYLVLPSSIAASGLLPGPSRSPVFTSFALCLCHFVLWVVSLQPVSELYPAGVVFG